MQWLHDGITHTYDDPGRGDQPVTTVVHGSEVKLMVELDAVTFPAEASAWTHERVLVS